MNMREEAKALELLAKSTGNGYLLEANKQAKRVIILLDALEGIATDSFEKAGDYYLFIEKAGEAINKADEV